MQYLNALDTNTCHNMFIIYCEMCFPKHSNFITSIIIIVPAYAEMKMLHITTNIFENFQSYLS